MKSKEVEVLRLELNFGCTKNGECERRYCCINPEEIFEKVCPYLVAADRTKQLVTKYKG